MLNLGFRNSRPIFLKRTFFSCNTFSVIMAMSNFGYELIFALLTFGDKG